MANALYLRRMPDEPPTRFSVWALRLAVFSFVVALLAIIIERADILEIMPVLVTFGAALAIAILAVLLAFAAFVMLWVNGGPGFSQAMIALGIGAGMLGYPAYLGYTSYMLPTVTDITTDPLDPPRFRETAKLRPADSIAYAGAAAARLQKQTWPDIEPLLLSVSPRAAYEGALAVVTKRKWTRIDWREPQPGRDGTIEAVARSPVMGFRDDVVIRIRAAREGTRVDIRSASRYGYFDFGGNATRVLALIDEIDDAAVEKPDKSEPPARPPLKPAAKPPAKPGQPAPAQPARR